MLSPDDRSLLVDLLAPAPGFRLRHAVATSFTVHLTALLPIPLGFAGMDLSQTTDPLGVLHAVREYADRIDVFCQAGMISVPAQRNDLLTFLEPMVHQVAAPRPGRLFHPKLWVLRYANAEDEVRFRLICGSRNLTHDKAWDAVISLDGIRTGHRVAVNNPICDLLESLPGRVPNGVPRTRVEAIAETVEALHNVEWEPPEDALTNGNWLAFHVFGQGRRTAPDLGGKRRLIVSPFMNDDGLKTAWPDGEGECTIVSRPESLDALDESTRQMLVKQDAKLWVLDDAASLPDDESDDVVEKLSLTGLHAKVYVVERDGRTHFFIGSTNATDAGWKGNDEILVEIVGKSGAFGVAATVNSDEAKRDAAEPGFGKLLKKHELGPVPAADPDADMQRRLERALCDLASIPFLATVDVTATHEDAGSTSVGLTVTSSSTLPAPPDGATLSIGLLTLRGQDHQPVPDVPLNERWSLESVEDITPFVVLRLTAGSPSKPIEVSCVVVAKLVNDPADRLDRVLARRVGTPEAFLRFLMLLLQLAGTDNGFPEAGGGTGSFGLGMFGGEASGVLESMVGVLASHPEAIDDINRFVTQLRTTEQGRSVLPVGWDELWPSVLAAREQLRVQR